MVTMDYLLLKTCVIAMRIRGPTPVSVPAPRPGLDTSRYIVYLIPDNRPRNTSYMFPPSYQYKCSGHPTRIAQICSYEQSNCILIGNEPRDSDDNQGAKFLTFNVIGSNMHDRPFAAYLPSPWCW